MRDNRPYKMITRLFAKVGNAPIFGGPHNYYVTLNDIFKAADYSFKLILHDTECFGELR